MLPVTRSAPSLARMCSRGGLATLAATTVALLMGGALPAQAIVLDPEPGEKVVIDVAADGDQFEWVVPDDITEVTIELAAGSGASSGDAAGGVGGAVTASLTVTSGQTLIVRVGAQGDTAPLMAGGQGSAVATADGDLLLVVGGGGAAFRCGVADVVTEDCGAGGAGGYSALSGNASGLPGVATGQQRGLFGTPGTLTGPGISGDRTTDGVPLSGSSSPSPDAAAIAGGVLSVAPPTDPFPASEPEDGLLGGGGGGFYAGGHGGMAYTRSSIPEDTAIVAGGGGGGSGYLGEGAAILEVRNNTGDGFASISYVVPEAPVTDEAEPEVRTVEPDPEPELVDAAEPTLVVSASEVRAGGQLELSGGGFAGDRTYPIILNSDPVLLGDVTTDARGAFATTVTIPASVHAGAHVISVGDARIPITVLAAETVPAPPTAPETAPQPELAATGTTETLSAAGLLALTMLALGGLLLRRVRQAEHV